MPRPPIKQQRARATRARIIAGSAAVFAENGYSGSSVADILDEASMTKGALYFHFETKKDVAEAILAAHTAWLTRAAETVRGRGLQGAVDLTYALAATLASDDVLRASARLSVDRETFGLAQEPAFRQWQTLCAELLAQAQEDDELRRDVDVTGIARVVMTTLLGAYLASWGARGGDSRLGQDLETFWRITLPGIATEGALGGVDPAFPGLDDAALTLPHDDAAPSV